MQGVRVLLWFSSENSKNRAVASRIFICELLLVK